jgi:hypothetical protein
MRYWVIAAVVLSAIPACADSRFSITIIPRPELPPGKGQCDIRLSIDSEVKITLRRDQIIVHTVSGEDARDDGSDCNIPLPDHDVQNFTIQPVDSRSEIRILERPSARDNFGLVVRILDSAAGFGRYHFRVSWDVSLGSTSLDTPPPFAKQVDTDHPPTPPGFVWNNAVDYRGRGAGQSVLNGRGQRLTDVRADIDLGGKIVVSFTAGPGRGGRGGSRPMYFTGNVMSREGARIRANMVTEDQRLHGTMTLSVDEKNNVNSVTMNATDGQDHLRITWDRQ